MVAVIHSSACRSSRCLFTTGTPVCTILYWNEEAEIEAAAFPAVGRVMFQPLGPIPLKRSVEVLLLEGALTADLEGVTVMTLV